MKIIIKTDVFNIAKRILNIDKYYFIIYNTSKRCYEVHHSKQVGDSYCLTLPFNCLDARTLDYVNKTKAENIKIILKQIEKENDELESADKSSALHSFNCFIEKLLIRR